VLKVPLTPPINQSPCLTTSVRLWNMEHLHSSSSSLFLYLSEYIQTFLRVCRYCIHFLEEKSCTKWTAGLHKNPDPTCERCNSCVGSFNSWARHKVFEPHMNTVGNNTSPATT